MDDLMKKRGRIIEDLRELVKIPSVTTEDREVAAALDFVYDLAVELGLRTGISEDRSVVTAEVGQGKETLGILVHVDVVDPLDVNSWTTPPFQADYRDGRVYGRGSLDNKGPVILCLHLLGLLKEAEGGMTRNVRLIIGSKEETNWTDMDYYTSHYPLPDFGFSPDGEFPIQNKEKGYADLSLRFQDSGQSAGAFLHNLRCGKSLNTVPDSASVLLCEPAGRLPAVRQDGPISLETVCNNVKISARGKSCHSSLPEEGVNALCLLADYIAQIDSISLSENGVRRLLRFVHDKLSPDVYGTELGLSSDSEYVRGEYFHKTTAVPTTACDSETGCLLTLNLRTQFGLTEKQISRAFDRCAAAYGYQRMPYMEYHNPLFVPSGEPFLREMARAYEKVLSQPCGFGLCFGTTYAKAMKNIVSFGPLFPGEKDVTHQVDEFVDVDHLLLAGEIYLEYITRVCF